jgi:hypothetical protein
MTDLVTRRLKNGEFHSVNNDFIRAIDRCGASWEGKAATLKGEAH